MVFAWQAKCDLEKRKADVDSHVNNDIEKGKISL